MKLLQNKTKKDTGFEYLLNSLSALSPYGKKRLQDLQVFTPGEEDQLVEELDKLEKTIELIKSEAETLTLIEEVLARVKDNTFTIERSQGNVLSVVELFEIKTLLLQMQALLEYYKKVEDKKYELPRSFKLEDLSQLLDILDPNQEKTKTFYIYDSFSEKLKELRQEKRSKELDLRSLQKEIKCQVENKHKILLTPKFEYLVSKHDKEKMKEAMAIEDLMLAQEDYMNAVFTLKSSREQDELKERIGQISEAIEEEEFTIREGLSSEIGTFRQALLNNCKAIGEIDFNIAKAHSAIKYQCVKPRILKEHRIAICEGRQVMLQDILDRQEKEYKPVSIELKQGVTCITGANMGGKTLSLKMLGQCVIMAQHSFFIPATYGEIGLSSFVHFLLGDSQNLNRGLSSFGSEIEDLKKILERSKAKTLILIDEIASGTNPIEGRALTKSIINYLSDKPFISLITTHYDRVAEDDNIKKLQVRGLADVDLEKLKKEIKYADRSKRLRIINKYMDYNLCEAKEDREVPKDALNIAAILGLDTRIVEDAKKYMEDQ